MKRFLVLACVLVGLAMSAGKSQAYWSSCTYSGYQPCWNIFAKRYKCLTPEEARLQKFWADYYDALKHYYKGLSHIDWVAYYKNHGYLINNGCCGGPGCGGNPCCYTRNYAPVFITPSMQWAMPNNCAGGPPTGPCCNMPPPGPMGGPMMGGPGY